VRSLHVRSVPPRQTHGNGHLSSSTADSDGETLSNGNLGSAEKEEDEDCERIRPGLQYDIYKGAHWFRHRGHIFRLARGEDQQGSGGMTVENGQKLTLTVLGRSAQPVKDLIAEAMYGDVSKARGKPGTH